MRSCIAHRLSTMTPSTIASVFFFCLLLLLLPARHSCASSNPSYKLGSRQFFSKTPGKSSGNSQQASAVPPATTCSSSIATGLAAGNSKLPVVHRQNPCSPLHGLPSLTAADVLRRDVSRIRRRFSSQSSMAPAAPSGAIMAPSPAATAIPVNISFDPSLAPDEQMDYSVLVGYGTPEQQFPVFISTSYGMSLLRCKPCSPGSNDCEPAFDPSRSSTFTHVPCGSPDCPVSNCSSSLCQPVDPYSGTIKGAISKDVLTLPPLRAVQDFRFLCLEVEHPAYRQPEAGMLDLSRDRNSLPSRLSLSPAFSYCLPQSPSSLGFLSLGGNATVREDNRTVHAPLVNHEGNNPMLARAYFIDLVGMSLDGDELPILADAFGANGTLMDLDNTFTLLPPAAYTPLRDAFREKMSVYNRSVPGFDGFDTCYNFTGTDDPFIVPVLQLHFSNGESLQIGVEKMLYHDDTTGKDCLAFSAMDSNDDGPSFPSIGTYHQASMEVVYDVAGGKVGFIPHSC